MDASGVTQLLLLHVVTSFILSQIKALLLEVGVFESWFRDLELLEVLVKLLWWNHSPIHQWIGNLSPHLIWSFWLPNLPSVKMLVHDFPVGLSLFVILEQILFDVNWIWVVVACHFVLYARWIHQVSHLHKVCLLLQALSVCMIPLFVVNSVG